MRGRLEVDVSYAARRPWVPRRAQFEQWVRAASAALPISRPVTGRRCPCVVSVRVVGAARSRSLNARYRGHDKSTNVLSFCGAGLGPDGVHYLGELVICAPVVAREAAAQAISRNLHWAHMTVHGMLHLFGFDHERAAEAREMADNEVQILDRLGFSTPYP